MTVQVDKKEGKTLFICDKCGNESIYPIGTFYEAVGHSRTQGWKVVLEDRKWKNICFACSQGFGKK